MCRICQSEMSGIIAAILVGILCTSASLSADDFKSDGGPAKAKETSTRESNLEKAKAKETKTKETKTKETKTKEVKTKEAKIKEAKEAKAKEVMAREVSLGISPSQIELPSPSYGISEALLKLHNDFRRAKECPLSSCIRS